MTTLYGISNCDTVRKARKWLETHEVPFTFHDFRKHGLAEEDLRAWADAAGWETLLNRRGVTWRKLPEAQREGVDEARAIALMLDNPTLIKRPVLVTDDGQTHVGFKPGYYETIFPRG